MKKMKSLILKDIDLILELYEPVMNQLSEVEKTDFEHLKICSKILRDESIPTIPGDLVYIIRTINPK